MTEPYSDMVDGVEVVGILFKADDAKFYEFQDPDTHDHVEKLVCPRSGDTITHDSQIESMMCEIMGAVKATVPREQWMEFREIYVEADEHDFGLWTEKWDEMKEADPRF